MQFRTLSYEICFYILGGATGVLLATKQKLIAALVIATCVRVFCVQSAHYLLFWFISALSALMVGDECRRLLAALGLVVSVIGCVCLQLAIQGKSFAPVLYFPVPISEAFVCIGVSFAIPFLCHSKVKSALSILKRPAGHLGAISYALYLVHFPINIALNSVFPKANDLSCGSLTMFAARIAIIGDVTYVFYLAFERNTPALRRKLNSLSWGSKARKYS